MNDDEIVWCCHDYVAENCPYCALIDECAVVAASFHAFEVADAILKLKMKDSRP